MRNVYIETYGCQMNEYDTEIIRAILQGAQYRLTDSLQTADLVLINTCSVRENANRKVFNRIRNIKYEYGRVKVGVLGCMATDFKRQLLEDSKFRIDFVVGPDSYKKLPDILRDLEQKGTRAFDVTLSDFETYSDIYPSHIGGANAWLAVMRGCDNYCSYCVVPYTRGRERSRSPRSILEEVEKLADEGFRQVTLLGQNVNSYHYGGVDFPDLLQSVSAVEGIERVRFTSPHPKDFPYKLLKVIADNPFICKHIHFPLQAGNDRILKAMRRTYTRGQYLKTVRDIRRECADMVLTTDIIVGFPTEAPEEFLDTINAVKEVQFDSAFIFKYSERPGTAAAKKYTDDVAEEEKTRRIVELVDLQKQISLRKNRSHIGQVHEVLIEKESTKKSDTDIQGRNDGNKIVIIPNGGYKTGQFVDVRITDASANVLKGVVVKEVEKG